MPLCLTARRLPVIIDGMTVETLDTDLDRLSALFSDVVQRQQGDGDPAHEDFYSWGWALSDFTARVQDAGRVLAAQVQGYGDRRILRDDEGGDPAARLDEARACLVSMMDALGVANAAARSYHSAIGHVAVEVDPEATS